MWGGHNYAFVGDGGWFIIFRLFKSILFIVNWILLYFFHIFLKKYHFMFINIVFLFGSDRLSGLLSFVPAVLFSILTPLFSSSSSVSLSYFILAFPMRECLGKHSWMSSPFPIAILNGASFFLSLVQEKLNMPSGHYYRLCSWSGRSNHLIKLKFVADVIVRKMIIIII